MSDLNYRLNQYLESCKQPEHVSSSSGSLHEAKDQGANIKAAMISVLKSALEEVEKDYETAVSVQRALMKAQKQTKDAIADAKRSGMDVAVQVFAQHAHSHQVAAESAKQRVAEARARVNDVKAQIEEIKRLK